MMEMAFTKSIAFDPEEFRNVAEATHSDIAGLDPDAEFIEKLKSHDATAFETMVLRYSDDVFALLYRLTNNFEDATDLTQETFLRALRSIRSFRGEAKLKTWLYRIAVNESRNRYRWWKRRKADSTLSLESTIGTSDVLIRDTLASASASPEDELELRERRLALQLALLELPAVFREAVVLCDIEGLTYGETAVALNIGLGTVKSRISRGRQELRNRLRDL
jgi:RNA polymerase sigma-70 factor (ECF subfamily)